MSASLEKTSFLRLVNGDPLESGTRESLQDRVWKGIKFSWAAQQMGEESNLLENPLQEVLGLGRERMGGRSLDFVSPRILEVVGSCF